MSDIASIYATDFHVGWGDDDDPRYEDINKFIDYIEEANPVLLGLMGDEADPWEKNWDEILGHPTWIKLQNLVQRRSHKGRRTVWLHENHDYSAKPQHLPGADMVHGTVTLAPGTPENPGDTPIILIHGWQWDVYWGGFLGKIPGLAPLLFWISTHSPRLMIKLSKIYKGIQTPFSKKTSSKDVPEEKEHWNLNMMLMHGQARQWAIKKESVVLFGHTHYPDVQIDDGSRFGILNTGDWVDSFTYIVHREGKNAPELCRWKENEGIL